MNKEKWISVPNPENNKCNYIKVKDIKAILTGISRVDGQTGKIMVGGKFYMILLSGTQILVKETIGLKIIENYIMSEHLEIL